jgi:hypothetical protein
LLHAGQRRFSLHVDNEMGAQPPPIPEDPVKNLRIRKSATVLALGAAAALCAGTVAAEDKPAPVHAVEASIPFVDHNNIRDWQADKMEGIWIQDQRRNWYYAKLLSPCIGLDWALSIGFVTGGGSGQLDKFSSILVPDEGRCQITSLTRSEAPPPSVKKKKHKVTDEKVTRPD